MQLNFFHKSEKKIKNGNKSQLFNVKVNLCFFFIFYYFYFYISFGNISDSIGLLNSTERVNWYSIVL